MKWSHPISLKELSTSVNYGFTASATDEEIGPKFLRITDIVPDQIRWDNVPYCEIDESKFDRFSLQRDDIVVARTGATVGYAKLIRDAPPSIFASYLVRIRIDPDKAYPGYVGRIVESKVFKNYVWSRIGGAAQPNANAQVLSGFKLRLPDHNIQIRIADILSAYDDLIENNRRRIELLEQSAHLLYKEWFVHLRFPGHEHTTIQDGAPEGWEKTTLTQLAEDVSYGYTASSTTDEVGPKFLRITDIVPSVLDWDRVPFCEATESDIARNRLEVGDVVVARTGATVGYAKRISDMPCEAVYASYLVRFRFDSPAVGLIAGIYMESDRFKHYVRNNAGGAAQPNANARVLGSAELLVPPKVLQTEFEAQVDVLTKQRTCLIRQNSSLSKARDLILPRLTNGEISV